KDSLHYPCLGYVHVKHLKPPFKIGISGLNGMIEGQQYLDNVEVEKFTVFNMNENLKKNYTTFKTKAKNNNYHNNKTEDLIENFTEFSQHYNSLHNPEYIKALNK